jgi:patatin-like phospholipase/acyl hydrolase
MIRVLSVSGGGIRALLTLQVLKYVSRKAGKPLYDLFDYVAGASTGAICAVGLTSPRRLSPTDLEQLYIREAANIFDKRWLSLGGLTGPKYHAEGLEKALQGVLGGSTLSEALVPTLAMAYDLRGRAPALLTSHGPYKSISAWSAVRASSAAPTYFEPYKGLVDGGLVANSPALVATIEACKLYNCTVRDIICLSIGTGTTEEPIDPEAARSWGPLGWVKDVIGIALDGGCDLVDQEMRDLLPDANYLCLNMPVRGSLAEMDNITPANMLALQQAGNQLVASNMPALDRIVARLIAAA